MVDLSIENGLVLTFGKDQRILKHGTVAVEDGKIVAVEKADKTRGKYRSDRVIDATGKVVMPGLICAHHHLYSTFARGMPSPRRPPANFTQLLERIWWKLDSLLTKKDIYYSSLVALMECIRNGTTTVIDHHESQSCQKGSLNEIAKAFKDASLRGCICYGTSDRYGRGREGLEENRRFLSGLKSHPSCLRTGMVGLHALFTVIDETLEESVKLAREYNVGIHVHCAESNVDQQKSLEKYGVTVVERLFSHGALGERSAAAHCVHVSQKEVDILKATKTNVVNNPESNMNNAVGSADILTMLRKGINVGLGTDGMSSDMLAQMRCAYLLQRHARQDPRVGFSEASEMLLANNPRIVRRIAGWRVGEISAGALADIILVDYIPPTAFDRNSFLGHLMFGLVDATVDTTICNGKILMEKKKFLNLDEKTIAEESSQLASEVWKQL